MEVTNNINNKVIKKVSIGIVAVLLVMALIISSGIISNNINTSATTLGKAKTTKSSKPVSILLLTNKRPTFGETNLFIDLINVDLKSKPIVKVGGVSCKVGYFKGYTFSSKNKSNFSCTTGKHKAGKVDIVVKYKGKTITKKKALQYVNIGKPTIVSVSPNIGLASDGINPRLYVTERSIGTIKLKNFIWPRSSNMKFREIKIGGVICKIVRYDIYPGSIGRGSFGCIAGKHKAGVVDVTIPMIKNRTLFTTVTKKKAFTYKKGTLRKVTFKNKFRSCMTKYIISCGDFGKGCKVQLPFIIHTFVNPNNPNSQNNFIMWWNTKANGSGKTYRAGKFLTIRKNVTLYTKWKK
jgi:hypothetical protein